MKTSILQRQEAGVRRLVTVFISIALTLALPSAGTSRLFGNNVRNDIDVEHVNFQVSVLDKIDHSPLALCRVSLYRGRTLIAAKATNTTGNTVFRDVPMGTYILVAHYVSYRDYSDTITIDLSHTSQTLELEPIEHGVEVTASRFSYPNASATTVDVRSGVQTFDAESYHAAPDARATSLIQQSVAGAVRAPTGEVHVRGMHGEYMYYVDGIPIPLGVFGGLNEVVDTKVISHATFLTGGFPAEYGRQMAVVNDIQTSVPSGHFHADASVYAGSYATSKDSVGKRVGNFKSINSNGQSLSLSNQSGGFGYFISGSRQETDRRIDLPTAFNEHDHGFDYFVYAKAHYIIDTSQYLSANFNYAVTETQIPFDPAEGVNRDDQNTTNSFQTLSYFKTSNRGADGESNLFLGAYAREGTLRFTPDVHDDRKQYLGNDTTVGYVVAENRNFTSIGFRGKYGIEFSHQIGAAAGVEFSNTMGTEDFAFYSDAALGPHTVTDFSGNDFGVFVQTQWHPAEWTEVDFGVRYDRHKAPEQTPESAVSPRIKISFFPDEVTSLYLYYGRLFMPTNIEGLRNVSEQVGQVGLPTLAERDDFFEITFSHREDFGLTGKAAAFYRESTPGLDDETLGSSAIKTPVNIGTVRTTGVELALSYSHTTIPFSAFANLALIHAIGSGGISGGFLPADTTSASFDLDHDGRLSMVYGVSYTSESWFAGLTAMYGSGLANGKDIDPFLTGLLDFNAAAHTDPYWVFNASAGCTFNLGSGLTLRPSLFITNIFDAQHLLKGAFFSGATFEEPRNVTLRLAVSM